MLSVELKVGGFIKTEASVTLFEAALSNVIVLFALFIEEIADL